MYKTFFQLTRCPFEISPDPSLFYATLQHQEALAGLYYGIKAAKGKYSVSSAEFKPSGPILE